MSNLDLNDENKIREFEVATGFERISQHDRMEMSK